MFNIVKVRRRSITDQKHYNSNLKPGKQKITSMFLIYYVNTSSKNFIPTSYYYNYADGGV